MPGVIALVEALDAHPLRVDVALMLYSLHLRAGNRESADELYGRYFARPRHPQARLAARLVFAREATAAINRQIMTYNEAVRLANRGDDQSAMRILEDLVTKASDEKVIQDATALRARLEKRKGMRRSGGAL